MAAEALYESSLSCRRRAVNPQSNPHSEIRNPHYVVSEYGVVPLRSSGHDSGADTGDLLEPRDVVPRGVRESIEGPHAGRRRRPARHRLVDRLAGRELADV